MIIKAFFAVIAIGVFAVARINAQAPPPTQTPAAAANLQAGKDLYLRYSCYACHVYDGHGGAGARLVPMRMTAERFTAYVHNPRK